MRICRAGLFLLLFAVCLFVSIGIRAEEPSKQTESGDVLVFINGDQMTGRLMHSSGDTVTFHSDMAGDINVSWSKVKELRSQRQFVVLGKNQRWSWRAIRNVPAGSINVENDKIELKGRGEAEVMPIKETADVLDAETFNREAVQEVNFFRRWTGAASLGLTTVKATQNNYTYTTGVALMRSMPSVAYLPPRNRTTLNFTGSYSRITQRQAQDAPQLPDLKTSIFHGDSERDEYITSRIYLLVGTAFDHNFSQGLDLQQIYGGGVGWTVLKRPNQTLDLKATLQYEKQQFLATSLNANTNLIGSTFSLSYLRKLPFKAVFQQQMQYLPAYNQPSAYSANETNSLTFPVYKRLGFQIGTQDSYLNNPPPVMYPAPINQRNSFQVTSGISYRLK
jgi:hypothetical protein